MYASISDFILPVIYPFETSLHGGIDFAANQICVCVCVCDFPYKIFF